MSNVQRITPRLLDVEAPAAIRDLPAWVVWRFEANPGAPKPRKVPYYANGGKRHGEQGSPSDVANLVTFDAAKAAAARRGFDGVGFAALAQFGICALDFDNCITAGKIHPDVEALLADTYAEYSPSGQGIRVFFKGDLGNGKNIRGEDFGMEVFSTRGFVTFTGNALDITELMGNTDSVAPINDEVRALHASRFRRPDHVDQVHTAGDPVGLTSGQIAECLASLPTDLHYDDWIMVGMAVHCETGGDGFDLWDEWSQLSGKYTTREYNEDRWRSFGRGSGPAVTGRTLVKMARDHGCRVQLNTPASAEEFEALTDAPAANDKPLRFQVVPAHEFASGTPPTWRIKDVLPEAELVVMYGASGSGKSFVALDMAACIARGAQWRGKRVKQGRVAYIAAEGAGGFRKRLTAYAQANQLDLSALDVGVIHAAPNMMEKADAVDVVKAIRAWGGADIIIIDTFAQVMPGANENAGEDVGKALTHCKRIHEATGAMIMLIHHAGKDASKGARGWSGLRAAADAELEVVRETNEFRSLKLTKSKDGEDGQVWGFSLEVVQIGVDEDLEPVTSCVVVEAAVPVGGVSSRKLGKNEAVVNAVIQEIAQSQTSGIEIKPVLDEVVRRIMARDGIESDKKGNVRSNARRALNLLCAGDEAPYYLDPETNCIEVI